MMSKIGVKLIKKSKFGEKMSTDLYSSEIDDNKYGGMSIDMNVHCHLSINSFDANGHDASSFQLPPTTEGR